MWISGTNDMFSDQKCVETLIVGIVHNLSWVTGANWKQTSSELIAVCTVHAANVYYHVSCVTPPVSWLKSEPLQLVISFHADIFMKCSWCREGTLMKCNRGNERSWSLSFKPHSRFGWVKAAIRLHTTFFFFLRRSVQLFKWMQNVE